MSDPSVPRDSPRAHARMWRWCVPCQRIEDDVQLRRTKRGRAGAVQAVESTDRRLVTTVRSHASKWAASDRG